MADVPVHDCILDLCSLPQEVCQALKVTEVSGDSIFQYCPYPEGCWIERSSYEHIPVMYLSLMQHFVAKMSDMFHPTPPRRNKRKRARSLRGENDGPEQGDGGQDLHQQRFDVPCKRVALHHTLSSTTHRRSTAQCVPSSPDGTQSRPICLTP